MPYFFSDFVHHTRYAPTPSGFLHRGNAFSFVLAWLLARASGGRLGLRIDDLDQNRVRRAYIDDIFQTLHWLQLDWDYGPRDTEDFLTYHSQIRRIPTYEHHLQTLQNNQRLFACTCSRRAVREAHPEGLYTGVCLHQAHSFAAPQTAWRIRTEGQPVVLAHTHEGRQSIRLHEQMPYFVVRQKDQRPAYMIASLVDDCLYGVTTLVRGQDLLLASAAQVFLSGLLPELSDFGAKVFFLHHPLLKDDFGNKLSKSEGAAALYTWRAKGVSPAAIFNDVAAYLHVPPADTADELLKVYRAANA
ncbi:MAG: glutamate--tRNA ligase family protein [Bernardetiaceae bacterium]